MEKISPLIRMYVLFYHKYIALSEMFARVPKLKQQMHQWFLFFFLVHQQVICMLNEMMFWMSSPSSSSIPDSTPFIPKTYEKNLPKTQPLNSAWTAILSETDSNSYRLKMSRDFLANAFDFRNEKLKKKKKSFPTQKSIQFKMLKLRKNVEQNCSGL